MDLSIIELFFCVTPSHRPAQRDFQADELMTVGAAVQAFRTHRPIKWSRRDLHITAAGSFGLFGSHCFLSGNTSQACCSKQQQACVCVCVGLCLYLELGDDIMECVMALTAGNSSPHTWCVCRVDFFLVNVSNLTVQLYYKGPK